MKVTFKDFIGVKPVKRTFESNTRIEKPRDVIKPQVLKEQIANPTPQLTSTPIPTSRTLVDRTLEHIKKLSVREQANSFEQPSPSLVPENLHDVVQKLKVLEAWLSKISALGPGGGEVNLAFMEMAIKSVTSSSYNVTTSDYYIGVNYAGAVNIYLPPFAKEGKVIVIKDELGEASRGTNRFITVWPSSPDTIDSRSYAILAFDWGSLTLVYKDNMWRVI